MLRIVKVLDGTGFAKKLKNRSLLKIAEGSKVSYPTLLRMRNGEADEINISTLKKVMDFLEGEKNGK